MNEYMKIVENQDYKIQQQHSNNKNDVETPFFVQIILLFMFISFLQQVFDKDNILPRYLEHKYKPVFLYYYNYYLNEAKNFIKYNFDYEYDNEEDKEENEIENEEEQEQTPMKIYDDKYLEEFNKMENEIVFTEKELQMEIEQRLIIKNKLEDNLKLKQHDLENKIHYFENRQTELIENKNDDIYKDYADEYELTDDYELSDENEFDDEEIKKIMDLNLQNSKKREEIKQKVLKNLELELFKCIEEYELLKTKTIDETDDDINKMAKDFVMNERLDNLKNSILIENTPLGNVIMFYNNSRNSFEYYSDSIIPYRYLEVIGRKYVVTYKCKTLYIDMVKEIEEAEKRLAEKKLKEQELEEKKKEENSLDKLDKDVCFDKDKTKEKRNVFAKLKTYNKDISIKAAAVPLDRPAPVKQTDIKEEKVIKERANRYSYEGKIANFNFLKKIDRKIVDKRYAISFSEFKKMQKK
jgi:hypothetical protein